MTSVWPSRLLQLTLVADGALGLGMAVAHVLAGPLLADWLTLPEALLLGTGVFLIGWGAWLVMLGRAAQLSRAAVWTVIVGNAAWALAALALLLGGIVQPSGWGSAYLVVNAVAVLVLAEIEWFGLRRSAPAQAVRVAEA